MLRLNVFGGLRLIGVEGELQGAPQQKKPLALLALLAVAGEKGLTRDKLLGYLWGESDEERARGNLKQAVYALRRDSGQAELVLGTSILRVNPAILTSDIAEFESALSAGNLELAVGLYQGPFLDGVFLEEAEEFDLWVEEQRQRLAGHYRRGLDALARRAEQEGAVDEAVRWLGAMAVTQPLDSGVALRLIDALERAGDRKGALDRGELFVRQATSTFETSPPEEILAAISRLRMIAARGPNLGVPPSMAELPRHPTQTLVEDGVSPGSDHSFSTRQLWPSSRRSTSLLVVGVLVGLGIPVMMAASGFLKQVAIPVNRVHEGVEGRPRVGVVPFENITGIDSLDYLGPIIANRVAVELQSRGVSRAPERESHDTRGADSVTSDVIVQGKYRLSADSLLVDVEIRGPSPSARDFPYVNDTALASRGARDWYRNPPIGRVPTSVVLFNDLRSGFDAVATRVASSMASAFDSSHSQWGIAPSVHFEPRAWSWFLSGIAALDSGPNYIVAAYDFDHALMVDSSLSLALIYRMQCAGAGIEDGFPSDASKLSEVRKELAERRGRLSPFEAALSDYFPEGHAGDADQFVETAQTLHRLAPDSRRPVEWLGNSLTRANRLSEVVDLFDSLDVDEIVNWHGLSPPTVPLCTYANALHLTGNYNKELALSRRLGNASWYCIGASIGIRALAGLHDTSGLRSALTKIDASTLSGPSRQWQTISLAEELGAHGYGSMADSIIAPLRGTSCLLVHVWDPYSRAVFARGSEYNRVENGWAEESSQLEAIRGYLRYGCKYDAARVLAGIGSSVRDSLYFEMIAGEFAAREMERSQAESSYSWLQAHAGDILILKRTPAWAVTYSRSRIDALLGRRQEAIVNLSAAIRLGMPSDISLHTDPLWRDFADDPAFIAATLR